MPDTAGSRWAVKFITWLAEYETPSLDDREPGFNVKHRFRITIDSASGKHWEFYMDSDDIDDAMAAARARATRDGWDGTGDERAWEA